MNAAVEALVAYFTGPMVVHHSIGLQVGGLTGQAAQAYYDARMAVGVHGYASADEARREITRTLGIEGASQ